MPVAAIPTRSDARVTASTAEGLAPAVPDIAEPAAAAAPEIDAVGAPAGSQPPPATEAEAGSPGDPAGLSGGTPGAGPPAPPTGGASPADLALGVAELADPAEGSGAGAAPAAFEPVGEAVMPALEIEDMPATAEAPPGTAHGTPVAVQLDFDPIGAITGAAGSVARGVGDVAGGVFDAVKGRIASVVGGLSSGWGALQGSAGQIVGSVTGAISSGVQTVVGLGTQAAGRLQAGFQQAGRVVSGAGQSLMGIVTRSVGQLGGVASSLKAALLAMDGEALRAAYNRLTGMLGGVFDVLQKGREALTAKATALWGGLERGFSTTVSAVRVKADAISQRLRAAADAAGQRLSGLWDGMRKRAEAMSGIAGAAARLAAAAVDRLLAGARALWDSIQARFETVRAGLGRVVAGVTEQLDGARNAVQRRVGEVWSGIGRAWGAARGAVEGAVGKAASGIGEMLGKFRGFAIAPVVDKISKISGLVKAVGKAVADPEGAVAPVLQPIIARLEAGMPAAGYQKLAEQAAARGPGGAGPTPSGDRGPAVTPASGPTGVATPAPALPVQRQGPAAAGDGRSTLSFGQAFDVIGTGLEKGWAQVHVGEMLWKTVKTLLWPWPTVKDEFVGLWTDWKTAAGSLFSFRDGAGIWGWLHDLWSNFLHLLDFPLVLWRRLNNIALALWGVITLALMALGAFGGATGGAILGAIGGFLFGLGIGAAPGAGAGAGTGGLAGAGAGFAVALAVGEAFIISLIAAETLSLVKSVIDLVSSRQTREEQVHDGATAAENVITMGVTLVLMGLGWVGGKVATVIAPFVRAVLPDALVEAFAKFKQGVVDARLDPATAKAKATYDAIDPATKPANVTVVDTVINATPDGKPTRIQTEVTVDTGESGHVTRSYDPATGKLAMEEAFLDAIPEGKQMVEVNGEKMRLQQYVTLRQMRAFGIGFGGLRVVKMSTIQNIRALIEMDVQMKAGAPKDVAVMKTHSVKYAQRTLAGAGETVKSAKVDGGGKERIGRYTDHYERADPSRKAGYDKLLQDNPYADGTPRTRDSVMYVNYDIELTLEAATPPPEPKPSVVPITSPHEQGDK